MTHHVRVGGLRRRVEAYRGLSVNGIVSDFERRHPARARGYSSRYETRPAQAGSFAVASAERVFVPICTRAWARFRHSVDIDAYGDRSDRTIVSR
jgi:hypothetical protein